MAAPDGRGTAFRQRRRDARDQGGTAKTVRAYRGGPRSLGLLYRCRQAPDGHQQSPHHADPRKIFLAGDPHPAWHHLLHRSQARAPEPQPGEAGSLREAAPSSRGGSMHLALLTGFRPLSPQRGEDYCLPRRNRPSPRWGEGQGEGPTRAEPAAPFDYAAAPCQTLATMDTLPPDRSRRAFSYRGYRFFWFATMLTTFAVQIVAVSVGWQIYDLTGQ